MHDGLVNIHTHKSGEGIRILDLWISIGGVELEEGKYYSAGIHPMTINTQTGNFLRTIEYLAAKGKICAIGEAGLDRRSATDMDKQQEIFGQMIEIAAKYQLPLIIHCVKAYPELIALYKKYKPEQAWIVHGFNNNRETLAELLRHGFYISIGKSIMDEQSNGWCVLPEIPLDRLFLETDNADYNIEEIYRNAAKRIGLPYDELIRKINDNFEWVFKVKVKN